MILFRLAEFRVVIRGCLNVNGDGYLLLFESLTSKLALSSKFSNRSLV